MIIVLFFIFLWLIVGTGSFVFFWTSENDFTIEEVLLAMLAAVPGPFTFVIGIILYTIIFPLTNYHLAKHNDVLIKKRK